jgi:flagellar motor switch protein FliM
VFPLLEMLLGGTGKSSPAIRRDITDIGPVLLDGLVRIILDDLRKAHTSEAEQARILRLVRERALALEARLLGMEEGHLLVCDYPVDRPRELLVNETRQFRCRVVRAGKNQSLPD